MRTFVVFATILAASSQLAVAQPSEPAPFPPAHPRVGIELGAGLWGGNMSCRSQNGSCNGFAAAGGFNLEGRWFWNPQWGAFVDVWVMSHTENAFTITHAISTIGLQWRPLPVLTLAAGVGGAHAGFSYANVAVGASDTGGAAMIGASLDLVRTRRLALSIEARAGTGFYGNDASGMSVVGRSEGLGAQLTFFGL